MTGRSGIMLRILTNKLKPNSLIDINSQEIVVLYFSLTFVSRTLFLAHNFLNLHWHSQFTMTTKSIRESFYDRSKKKKKVSWIIVFDVLELDQCNNLITAMYCVSNYLIHFHFLLVV